MFKHIFMIFFIAANLIGGYAQSKQVAYCTAYLISATQELKCQGHYDGTSSLVGMYEEGWRLVTDISGSHGFILIFHK